jgi:uncharacterized protein YjeT (DUF2065 family)
MSTSALICIIVGSLIIVGRGPLVIAPAATLAFYRRLFATDLQVRVFGVFLLALGAGFAAAGRAATGVVGEIALIGGAAVALFALAAMLAFPAWMRSFADGVFDVASAMDSASLRVMGVLAVLIGAALIYVGGWVL